MAKEITIDIETARRLLFILSLEGDVKREEIEWALGIIHQIPGYESITLTKAVQDRALKEILVAIAAEQISPTTPKDLETLIEDAQKREAALEAAEKTGEKRTEEFIAAAEKAAKTKAQTKTPPVPPEPQAAAPETAAPSPTEAPVSLGIKITPEAGKVLQKVTSRIATAPFRAAVSFAGPTLTADEPGRAAALSLLARGVTSEHVEKKLGEVDTKSQEKLQSLVKAIKAEEQFFSVQTRLLKQAFPVKEITFLLSPESGLTQTQVAIFFKPQERGGFEAVPRRSFFGDLANRFGSQLFGKASSNFLKKGAEKVATKVAGKVATKLATEAATTAVAAAAGPPGWVTKVIAWLATEIGPKVLGWIKKHFKDILGVSLVAGGVLVGGGAGMAVALGGGLIWLGGAGLTTAGQYAGGFLSFFVSNLLIPAFAKPLLIILISVPVTVALILFIINSGAYVVPPSSSSVLEENPFIGVVKEVEPAGPFENSNLPVSVSYTITVTAKRGTITNISFEHKCEAIAEKGTSPCPAPLPETTPLEISPVEPYVYTYTQTYSGASYRDSLVINTFTVTADTPETTGSSARGVASIIIGNPPTGCYNIAGTWPANERAAIMAAVSNLIGGSPTYVARLCAAYSQVNLYYDPPKVCGAWGCAPGGNVIYFNSAGLGNTHNATYILAHESGHVLSYGSPNLYQAYLAFPGTLGELPVCTYGGGEPAEGFAEAIARFAVGSSCLANEPNNKLFVETYIFR